MNNELIQMIEKMIRDKATEKVNSYKKKMCEDILEAAPALPMDSYAIQMRNNSLSGYSKAKAKYDNLIRKGSSHLQALTSLNPIERSLVSSINETPMEYGSMPIAGNTGRLSRLLRARVDHTMNPSLISGAAAKLNKFMSRGQSQGQAIMKLNKNERDQYLRYLSTLSRPVSKMSPSTATSLYKRFH